jgi:predicted nucleic acid-binding protein
MPPILIDTNVLVYFFNLNDSLRQNQAIEIINQLQKSNLGYLSTQNLGEFFNVATRKLKPAIPPSEAIQHIQHFMRTFTILNLTTTVVLEAMRGVTEHKFAYFDAQLWAIAKLNQIQVIFSEDFQDGASIEGVGFVNPFKKGFDVLQWIY